MHLLFKHYNLTIPIIYSGSIIRRDLKEFIDNLSLPIESCEKYTYTSDDSIIIVDGCKGNKNVTLLEGTYVGVIDHHQGAYPEDVDFIDIRPHYGSCSTIIFEYYQEAGITISQIAATAFLVGLYTDTAFLTRGMDQADMNLFTCCYESCDIGFVGIHVRNKIQTSDLPYFRFLLKNLHIKDSCGFCFIPVECDQNLMGILADFCLSIQDIHFVMIIAFSGNNLNFSARSEIEKWDASEIVRELISPDGFGGGHSHMAGGFIPKAQELKAPDHDSETFQNKLFSILGITENKKETDRTMIAKPFKTNFFPY